LNRHSVRHLVWVLCALCLSLRPAPAQDLPDFGDSAGGVISPEEEHRLGQDLLRHLRLRTHLIEDPEIEAYVGSLGSRLLVQSDYRAAHPFTFFVVDDPAINAFAAPGGFIGIHSGLILHTEAEGELAGVLAHEIAHVTQRHMARSFERASQLSLPVAAAMLGAVLLATQNPEAGQAALAAISAGNVQGQINFTRAHEEEADRVGMQTLSRSGFDPMGIPAFFERLQRANRLSENAELPEFLRTHPVTVSRISDARSRADQLPRGNYQDSIGFYLMRAKLQVIAAQRPSTAVEYFASRIKSDPKATAAHYGYALALTKAARYDQARAELTALLRADGEQPTYLMASARLDIAAGRTQAGLDGYRNLLGLYPGYRPVLIGYSEALLAAGRPRDALKVLGDYARDHGRDISYYRLLAVAEGKSGSPVESQIATAELRFLSGETELACEQLRFAQRSRTTDHYQRQRIEARLKDMARQLQKDREANDESDWLPPRRGPCTLEPG
jgi:predicted Zn-dependent protease